MKKLFFLCLTVLFASLFSLNCQDRSGVEEGAVSDRYSASASASEGQVSDNEWVTQKKAILFFWTTWCPYCREQLKGLNSLYYELLNQGFKVYFVNVQESASKVQLFRAKMNIKGPVVLDTRGAVANRYRIPGFPTYIFLENGVEVHRSNFLSRQYMEKVNSLYED